MYFLSLLIIRGVTGGQSLSQHALGERQGTPLTFCQSITGLTHIDIHTHIHSYRQLSVSSSPKLNWSTQRRPTQARGEHANLTQKGTSWPGWLHTWNPLAARQ